MMNDIVRASFENFAVEQPAEAIQGLSYKVLSAAFLSAGFRRLEIDGLPSGLLRTYIQGDLYQLIDSYNELESILTNEFPIIHSLHLGDGVVEIVTALSSETAVIKIDHCHKLDVANLVTYTMTVPSHQYIWSWRSVMNTIIAQLPTQ